MSTCRFTTAALLCLVSAASAAAQDSSSGPAIRHENGPPSEWVRRSSGVFSLIQSRPAGQFGDNIGLGYGANAAYVFSLDHAGMLSLRADVGFVDYGSESKHVPLSPTVSRVQLKVSTDNYIIPVSFGPQLTWPRGRVRPYVNAGFGGQFFFTESSVDGLDDDSGDLSTTNQHDRTKSWVAGGGVYVPLYTRGLNIMLDAGVQYFTGGHARYLRPGSIVEPPDAPIQINALESDTHMAVVRIGVRIGG